MKILVSACLLGTPCRYDGKSKPCKEVIALQEKHTVVPVCPEVMGGLKTPRTPVELQAGRAIRKDGLDVTENYEKGARTVLEIAQREDIGVAILKARSPACSPKGIYDGTFNKALTEGRGICAQLLFENGILILSEEELNKLEQL